jgi:hypothetical protein
VIHLESSEAKNTAAGAILGCALPGGEASVDNEGRSILRIGGIPGPPPFQPGQPFTLMDFAALEY